MAKGIIYIMTTSVNGLIKIGKTDNYKNRMQILEQNGYWNVSGLKRFFAVKVDDYDRKEKLIHTMFSKSQVANSELFALDKHIAKELLESFNGEQVYPEISVEVPKSKTKNKKKPSKTPEKEIERKTPSGKASKLILKEIDVPNGAKLIYALDNRISCDVVDNVKNRVKYKGKEYSMTGLVKHLKGNNQAVQGSQFLLYEGKRLTDIRKEKGV